MSTPIKSIMPYAYFRNQIVPSAEASISVASHSLQYGTMCFGGMRGYLREGKARVLRLGDHHERLMNACKILGFDFHIPFEPFKDILATLIQNNAPSSDFYIRPFVFCDDEVLGPCMDERSFHLGVYMMPLTQYFKKAGGLRLMVSSRKKFSDASMSTKAKASGCYLNSALATSEARRNGYDEALMMDDNWNIVEASVANLFMVYRGQVITPHLGTGPLEGITMRTVMDLLADEGSPVRFDTIDRSMLYTCDELFLTGSAAQVTYVESVDKRLVGQSGEPRMGPVCAKVSTLFNDVIEMKNRRSEQWITQFSI
jgi:branched-chain amino acid aminotransferase